MASLTVVVMTYNEAQRIADCIRSCAGAADEVLVVDSESTDDTREIAAGLGARVIRQAWPGHVKQMTYGFEQACGEWVMQLDADERLSPQLREELRETLASPPAEVDGYRVDRVEEFLGRRIHCGRHGRILRIARRDRVSVGTPHAHPPMLVPGRTARLSGTVLHCVNQPLEELLPKLTQRGIVAAGDYWDRGRRAGALDLLFQPLQTFFRLYVWKGGFLDGAPGLVFCGMRTHYAFVRTAWLYEQTKLEARRRRGQLSDEPASS